MCGIFCICSKSTDKTNWEQFRREHINKYIQNRGPDYADEIVFQNNDINFYCTASVLWLQGTEITKQPIENLQSIFAYNGDIFGGIISDEERSITGDTNLFLNILQLSKNSKDLLENLNNIQGPYAFIYLDKQQLRLYFGRDKFGRRSLLLGKHENTIIVSSVAKRKTPFKFIELPALGIFYFDLRTQELCLLSWQHRNKNFFNKIMELNEYLLHKVTIRQELPLFELSPFKVPTSDEILYNRLTDFNFHSVLKDKIWLKNVTKLQLLIEKGLSKRLTIQSNFCKACLKNKEFCNHSVIGILFSGGVDCAILALLTNKFVDKNKPIDLINVSFDETKNFESPDRKTGRQTFYELKDICPERKWNFVEINISKAELDLERENHIADLIYPLNSILDDSLGCALWFASRGRSAEYISPCRLLIVGMGADELFGGYTRHKREFKNKSWEGLHDILNEDWQNLQYRNLGRDDRVVSDHGRQLRTPYLDEEVVEFVRNLKCWEKAWLSSNIPQEFGEKVLLRSLAFQLGLEKAAILKKRALQFGCRIADSKEKGCDESPRLV